jgi:hypothetical protein
MKWKKQDQYTWVRFNEETNKYDVIDLWETLPMFDDTDELYLINVDHHRIVASSIEEAYKVAIENDHREIDSFEDHASVEKYLFNKYGISVILPRKINFTYELNGGG